MEKKKIASTVKTSTSQPVSNKLTERFPIQKRLFIFAIGIVSLLVVMVINFMNRKTSLVQNEESKIESKTQIQGTQVCVGNNSFSFTLDTPYSLVDADETSIIVTTNNVVVSVGKNAVSPEESLTEFAIPFTKSGNTYEYQLTSNWSDEISSDLPILAKTAYINSFAVSIYYASLDEVRAKKTLTNVSQSIKEGCHET